VSGGPGFHDPDRLSADRRTETVTIRPTVAGKPDIPAIRNF
jgi:hypothetical protein